MLALIAPSNGAGSVRDGVSFIFFKKGDAEDGLRLPVPHGVQKFSSFVLDLYFLSFSFCDHIISSKERWWKSRG